LVSVHLPWIAQAAAEHFQPRMEASEDEHSFVAAGADGIQAPKGGAIKRAQTCSASTPGSDGQAPVSLVALLVVCAWPLRRLSRC
jgi:hypothetical protein